MEDKRTGCPDWCVQEHPADELPDDGWHRSATAEVPVVGWFPPGSSGPEGVTVFVALVLPSAGGEIRVRLEADELGEVDLDLSSAARIASALTSLVAR